MPEGHCHGLFQPAPGLRCRVMVEHHSSPSCAALFCEPNVRFGHEVPQLWKFQVPSLTAKFSYNLHDPEKSDLQGFQAIALLAGNCLSFGNCLDFPYLWFVYSLSKFWWHTRCAPGMLDCLTVSMPSREVQMVCVFMLWGTFEIGDFSMILWLL